MSRPNRLPPPPDHLQPETKRWWNNVLSTYVLEEHHRRLLQAACEAWDSMQTARAAIAVHGMTFVDRFGAPRTRPEVAIERDARLAFARLVRELDLDVEPPTNGDSRPPALRSNSRRAS
jgi:P27 family predicted phage terminase small subunit